MKPSILLLGQDLRLKDNPALAAAVQRGAPLVLLYVIDDQSPVHWRLGRAQRWWLSRSLKALDESLQGYGQRVVIRRGRIVDVVLKLIHETGADELFWNRMYEPYTIEALIELKQQCSVKSFVGNLLFEPWTISTGAGQPYKVFTPFWKSCLNNWQQPEILDAPQKIPPPVQIKGEEFEYERSWAKEFPWEPGEVGGRKRIKAFASRVDNYNDERNRPDIEGTSRLSPHLHFGEVSVREVASLLNGEHYVRELGWRDFSYHLLYHFPHISDKPFHPRFEKFPWHDNPEALEKWKKGETGFPIVDAGMRQLWHEGWMHGRVRMIVASFLTKDLLIPWQEGAKWFWDTLVDADLANNSASWQWTAGSGADAAPYFRIFNPTSQGEKFDPDGIYIKKWLPEGPVEPIVDHTFARKRALELYEKIK